MISQYHLDIFSCFAFLFLTMFQDIPLIYQYMIYQFDISNEQYAAFNVLTRTTNLCMMALGIPFLMKVLKLHETAVMVLFTVTAAILYWFLAYATTFKAFAIISAPAELRFLCFCVGRQGMIQMCSNYKLIILVLSGHCSLNLWSRKKLLGCMPS